MLLAGSVKHITASDISSVMIDIARNKASDQNISTVAFVQSDLFDHSLETGSYDAVLAFNFLHLLHDTTEAVGRIHELVKPDGLFISKTICLAEEGKMMRGLINVMEKLQLAPHVRFLKIEELERVITDGGFRIIETGDYPASPPNRFVVARKS